MSTSPKPVAAAAADADREHLLAMNATLVTRVEELEARIEERDETIKELQRELDLANDELAKSEAA